jgi:hypothetical protein
MLQYGVLFCLVLILVSSLAQAKDVSSQQAAYNNALQQMAKLEAEYKSDSQAVIDTEQLIEKKKVLLAEQQKKAALSRMKYIEAKEKLDQAQLALDKAWKD